jgi:hypothetical protein
MNAAVASRFAAGPDAMRNASRLRRFFGVVARPRSYRNTAYLLIGLPLGTVWFTVLVTALAASVSLLVVALLGIPLLLATWYLVRACANVERRVTAALVDEDLPSARIASGFRGNLWLRLRSMSRERARWRELGYLLLRFPVGVATFAVAVTAVATPAIAAYTPIHARYVDDSFGDWFWSTELEQFAARSPWSWLLVPLGLITLITAFHLLNALADSCRRWTAAWLR